MAGDQEFAMVTTAEPCSDIMRRKKAVNDSPLRDAFAGRPC